MNLPEDKKWILEALGEARKGVGLTAPNPAVGAVIVKDGVELARGWHAKAGGPHAERDALAKLSIGEAAGATIYVTLEPCSTEGRTGACCVAIIEAGIVRVVYGARDPNPAHAGGADALLIKAGIEVRGGVEKERCEELIRGFAMVQREGRPWVIAKTAMSLDGRITRPPGEGQWLSGEQARAQVQRLRCEVDAILTSGETLRRDNPALTLRGPEVPAGKVQPWRVVLTRQELDRARYQLFQDQDAERSLIFQGVDEYEMLRTLAKEREVNTVLVEAGGMLLGALQDRGLIDEWVIYLAPLVTGGPNPALGGEGSETLEKRLTISKLQIGRLGPDLVARGWVDRSGPRALVR